MPPNREPPVPLVRADRILVVEDEIPIRRALASALRGTARWIDEAPTGGEALARVETEPPDLVVLDLGLPDQPGIDVCRALRAQSSVPIVVVSARHSDTEKVALLNAGADDYVTKPFSVPELVARVEAHLRRAGLYGGTAPEPQVLTVGEVTIDLARRTAARAGGALRLTPAEWNVLRVLVQQAGRTLTHRQLFHAAFGRTYGNAQQNLRVHITNLRRKIERNPAIPELIVTEPGVGYRCELPP